MGRTVHRDAAYMIDGLTIDQLRTFLAAVDEGSFSAAGRRIGRAQSVVSQTIAGLETYLKIRLFDRTGRLPKLTERGRALVERARAAVQGVDNLRAFASELTGGVEPTLSIAVDALFPTSALTRAVSAFQTTFPNTPLRVYVDALGALLELVTDGRCAFAIVGTVNVPPGFAVEDPVVVLDFVFVASSRHALARRRGRIPAAVLHKHTQLVLSDRSRLTEGRTYGVSPGAAWHLADFGTKLAFLRAGLGWGGVPRNIVSSDLRKGQLVVVDAQEAIGQSPPYRMSMWPVYRAGTPPGPAGRWLIERLKENARADDVRGRRDRRSQPPRSRPKPPK